MYSSTEDNVQVRKNGTWTEFSYMKKVWTFTQADEISAGTSGLVLPNFKTTIDSLLAAHNKDFALINWISDESSSLVNSFIWTKSLVDYAINAGKGYFYFSASSGSSTARMYYTYSSDRAQFKTNNGGLLYGEVYL